MIRNWLWKGPHEASRIEVLNRELVISSNIAGALSEDIHLFASLIFAEKMSSLGNVNRKAQRVLLGDTGRTVATNYVEQGHRLGVGTDRVNLLGSSEIASVEELLDTLLIKVNTILSFW